MKRSSADPSVPGLSYLRRQIRAALRDPAMKGAEIVAFELRRDDWKEIAKEIDMVREARR